MNEIDMTQELKSLIRKHRALQASRPSVLSDAASIIENARIEQDIEENARKQVELGKQLLQLQTEREERQKERLIEVAKEGEQKVEQLLAALPAFAERVSIAFKALGQEYGEITRLAKEIASLNGALDHANRTQVGRGSTFITPNHLHKTLKRLYRECFVGADVSLPQQFEAFDLQAAVEDIRKSVTGG